jgi:hypothetical protein
MLVVAAVAFVPDESLEFADCVCFNDCRRVAMGDAVGQEGVDDDPANAGW